LLEFLVVDKPLPLLFSVPASRPMSIDSVHSRIQDFLSPCPQLQLVD
jgi:hypothetical protein